MSKVYVKGEPIAYVSTVPGSVDSIVADYSGDLATVYVQVHDTTPKATLTFTGVGVNDQTVTIGSVVYTWKTTLSTVPSVANEVLIGANEAASVAALLSAINADQNTGDSDTLWGAGTVDHPLVEAYAGHIDANDARDLPGTPITVVAKGANSDAVATTETGTNTSWDVATLPRLAATDVPAQTTALARFSEVTTAAKDVALGAIVVISSTENTYTPITYDDIYNGTTAEDRVRFAITFTADTSTDDSLATDANILFDYGFDGDLTDELGGNALVKSGGTDLFIPSPVPARALAYRASVEHCEHAANEATLELTGAMTLHTYVRRTASTDSVFLTFGNGASVAEANNHLFTVAIVDATGALIWSQENGAGTNSADTALPVLTSGEWVQVTYTRPTAATSVKLYLNGYLADTSGALTAPTGGTAGVLTVGGTEGSVDAPMDFASLTIFDTELTAAQVLAHCNRERGI